MGSTTVVVVGRAVATRLRIAAREVVPAREAAADAVAVAVRAAARARRADAMVSRTVGAGVGWHSRLAASTEAPAECIASAARLAATRGRTPMTRNTPVGVAARAGMTRATTPARDMTLLNTPSAAASAASCASASRRAE